MPHVLVTGAAGFIGSHTVDLLLEGGHQVTGIDNFRTGRPANVAAARRNPAFRFYEQDLMQPGVLDDVIRAAVPDAIIHLAALVSVQESMDDPALNFALNVQTSQTVAEAARRHRIPRLVFASSAAVYGETSAGATPEEAPKRPISPYGAAKLASEALLLGHGAAFGFTVRCQRYFNVYGPRQDPASPYSGVISIFDRRYREGKPVIIYGDGEQTRDFISVHDIARANVLAATRSGIVSGIANICTGRATSLKEIAAIFARHYPAVPAPTHAAARAGDILHSLGSPATAAAELGFQAKGDIATGLAELIRCG